MAKQDSSWKLGSSRLQGAKTSGDPATLSPIPKKHQFCSYQTSPRIIDSCSQSPFEPLARGSHNLNLTLLRAPFLRACIQNGLFPFSMDSESVGC